MGWPSTSQQGRDNLQGVTAWGHHGKDVPREAGCDYLTFIQELTRPDRLFCIVDSGPGGGGTTSPSVHQDRPSNGASALPCSPLPATRASGRRRGGSGAAPCAEHPAPHTHLWAPSGMGSGVGGLEGPSLAVESRAQEEEVSEASFPLRVLHGKASRMPFTCSMA